MRIAYALTPTGPSAVVDLGNGVWQRSDVPVPALIAGVPPAPREVLDLSDDDFLLPYRPRTIIGIGLNFRDTVAEMGWETPRQPYLFPKLSSSASGPRDAIVVDLDLSTRVDWEGELGVVIGRHTARVGVAEALDHVAGYVAANDISARDLQAADGQWMRGKGLNTFCPLGPWILTADQVPDPQDISIRTMVNGRRVQDGSTASMIFGVAELVSYCSRYFTLEPGDVILTGTPAGCGDFQDPPVALRPGDVVELAVEGLGSQRTPVVAPGASRETAADV